MCACACSLKLIALDVSIHLIFLVRIMIQTTFDRVLILLIVLYTIMTNLIILEKVLTHLLA